MTRSGHKLLGKSALILSCGLVFGLSGCGNTIFRSPEVKPSDKPKPAAQPPVPEPLPAPAPAPLPATCSLAFKAIAPMTLKVGRATSPDEMPLKMIVRDFDISHPDFEHFSADKVETDLVKPVLGSDGLPEYAGKPGGPITSAETFREWFTDTPKSNRFEHTIVLKRVGASSLYAVGREDNTFFPIDGKGPHQIPEVPQHNFHFTAVAQTNFVYKGGEEFTFSGDDDIWVFINNKRVVDLGGTHQIATKTVHIDELGLTKGQEYPLAIFYAERHSKESHLRIETSLVLLDPAGKYELNLELANPAPSSTRFFLEEGPPGMTLEGSRLVWRATASAKGTYKIRVRAESGSCSAKTSYDLTVQEE